MIEIFELTDKEQITQAAQDFKVEILSLDRAFLMQENGSIGVGVLGLENGIVIIKEIIIAKDINTDIPSFQYYDLLARSVLNVIRDFSPIKVRIKKYDEYFERFGFVKTDSGMDIMSDEIVFNRNCCSK